LTIDNPLGTVSAMAKDSGAEYLPIRYRIEIYDEGFVNDPEITFHSTTPFGAINPGDIIDPRTWPQHNLNGECIYQVVRVNHLLWEIEGSHVGHSLSVLVKSVKKKDVGF
jgi:hypothetical protein